MNEWELHCEVSPHANGIFVKMVDGKKHLELIAMVEGVIH